MPFLKSELCYGVNRPDEHEEEYEKERELKSFPGCSLLEPIVHGHQGKRAGHVCYTHGGESSSTADTAVQEIQVSHHRNIRAPWPATSMSKGQ